MRPVTAALCAVEIKTGCTFRLGVHGAYTLIINVANSRIRMFEYSVLARTELVRETWFLCKTFSIRDVVSKCTVKKLGVSFTLSN